MASLHLLDVLCTCVRGCLAAQRYIATELLRVQDLPVELKKGERPPTILELNPESRKKLLDRLLGSVETSVKSVLDFKEGSAAKDVVTTADILTQALLVRLLRANFAEGPFTIIGEEEPASPALEAIARGCAEAYGDADVPIPFEAALRAWISRWKGADVVRAASPAALRARVGIFIDPIDATNCFTEGLWEAPMTLVGLAVDGVPVGGVVNRLFAFPVGPTTGGASAGLSYVLDPAGEAAFLVHEGRRIALEKGARARAAGAALRVCESPTTRSSFLDGVNARLAPCEVCFARGSANKEFFLIDEALGGPRAAAGGRADVFVAPARTIMKWDCCAPHAFLRALGGEMYSQKGVPVRYAHGGNISPVEGKISSGEGKISSALAELPDGVVATTAAAKDEVARRMGWRL